MEVAIITVGDELLAGETTDTNGSWLAERITARGGTIRRILSVGDERDTIASYVRDWREAFDRVVVAGGIGGTHDDVTMAAIADAFDRDLTVDPDSREVVEESSRSFVESHPDLAERYDLGLDVEQWAATVEGGQPLENPVGLCPGCVVSNVYVLPGVPSELRAMFEAIENEFDGEEQSISLYTDAPEGALADIVDSLRTQYDISVGIYPGERSEPNRVTIRATDRAVVARAREWLTDRIDIVEE